MFHGLSPRGRASPPSFFIIHHGTRRTGRRPPVMAVSVVPAVYYTE
jgi:hypothetical protein